MTESQRVAEAEAFDAGLDRVKIALTTAGYGGWAQRITDAALAGSTGSEILFRVRGALIEARNAVGPERSLIETLTTLIAQVDRTLAV